MGFCPSLFSAPLFVSVAMATWLAAWHFQPQPPVWNGFLLPQSCPGSSGLGASSHPHCGVGGCRGRASRGGSRLQGFHSSGLSLPSEVTSWFQSLACLFPLPSVAQPPVLWGSANPHWSSLPASLLCTSPSLAGSQYFTYGPFICGWAGWLRDSPSGHVGPSLSSEAGPLLQRGSSIALHQCRDPQLSVRGRGASWVSFCPMGLLLVSEGHAEL